MDRIQSQKVDVNNDDAVSKDEWTFLADSELALIGGGIGDTVL